MTDDVSVQQYYQRGIKPTDPADRPTHKCEYCGSYGPWLGFICDECWTEIRIAGLVRRGVADETARGLVEELGARSVGDDPPVDWLHRPTPAAHADRVDDGRCAFCGSDEPERCEHRELCGSFEAS